jgi:hypothetical protein
MARRGILSSRRLLDLGLVFQVGGALGIAVRGWRADRSRCRTAAEGRGAIPSQKSDDPPQALREFFLNSRISSIGGISVRTTPI